MIHPDHIETLRRRHTMLVVHLTTMERTEEGLGAGFTKQQLVIAIRGARAERDALACAVTAFAGAKETLDFYADRISYMFTQQREPRTAVHGDSGRWARDTLTAAASITPIRADHHGNLHHVDEEAIA